MREIFRKDLQPADIASSDQGGLFVARYEGVTALWCIRRTGDNELVKSGFKSKGDALHSIHTELTPRRCRSAHDQTSR